LKTPLSWINQEKINMKYFSEISEDKKSGKITDNALISLIVRDLKEMNYDSLLEIAKSMYSVKAIYNQNEDLIEISAEEGNLFGENLEEIFVEL
jgi:hypothetical protein